MTSALEPNEPTRAGASADREHLRRAAARERRLRGRFGALAPLVLAVTQTPRHEQAWRKGAEGERRVGLRLAQRHPELLVLHDRRVPSRRANIDHIVVSSAGVLVVDAKHYRGPIRVHRSGWPRRGGDRLHVAGRDRTHLVDGLLAQVRQVADALADAELVDVPVAGALCFVDGDLPLRAGRVHGVPIVGLRGLCRLAAMTGALGASDRVGVHAELDQRLPAA